MHQFAKRAQTRLTELCHAIDTDYGLAAMPVVLLITMLTIPLVFIELVTWKGSVVAICDHRIDNKRANYRKDPHCARCGKPLCKARNEYGGVCLRERDHDGLHRNPYLTRNTEWQAQGSTYLNEAE